MSLPKALNFGLQRFDKATKEIIKIYPHKTSVSGTEQIIYRFPANGILDAQSLACIMNTTFTKTAGTATTNIPVSIGNFVRQMHIIVNGTVVWGGACTNFSDAYTLRRQLAETSSMDIGSNQIYDRPLLDQSAASATLDLMMADMPGFASSNVRFIPLAALGDVEIRLSLDQSRIPSDNTYNITVTDSYILASKLNFDDDMLNKMIAARLSEAPLEMALEQWTTYEGPSYAGGATQFNFSIATQSLNYVMATNKLTSGANSKAYYTSGGSGATHQLLVNGVPVTSQPLKLIDVWYSTVESLSGHGGNLLVDPKITSLSQWRDQKYVYSHRFEFPVVDGDEEAHLIGGLNTYGSTVPFTYVVAGASGDFKPVVIALHKSTVEVRPGRIVTLVP